VTGWPPRLTFAGWRIATGGIWALAMPQSTAKIAKPLKHRAIRVGDWVMTYHTESGIPITPLADISRPAAMQRENSTVFCCGPLRNHRPIAAIRGSPAPLAPLKWSTRIGPKTRFLLQKRLLLHLLHFDMTYICIAPGPARAARKEGACSAKTCIYLNILCRNDRFGLFEHRK
jgi:hypothetical protein